MTYQAHHGEDPSLKVSQAPPDTTIGCRDACGNRAEAPEAVGWQFLEITKQWRCPSCMRTLALVNLTAGL